MSTSMAARVLSARTEASLSQQQLAKELGINRSAVAQWERLERGTKPSIENLAKIADITGVGFEWLATGRGTSPRRRRSSPHPLAHEQATTEFEVECLQWLRRIPARKHALTTQLLAELASRR